MYNSVCRELNNYFERKKLFGLMKVENGALVSPLTANIQQGQYFRIVGSVLNDGIYQFPAADLQDEEEFDGSLWLLAFPVDFVALVSDIEEWQKKNGAVDSAAMSPFTSESFGGYSYSKGASDTGKGANTWQGAFKSRLNAFRRMKGI